MAQMYTRREISALLLKGAAGLALGKAAYLLTACSRETTPTATPEATQTPAGYPRCNLSFRQVKSGAASPQAYLKEREICLPEAAKAKNSGMFKGFLFEPSDEELGRLLEELFASRTSDTQALRRYVRSSIDNYKSVKHGAGTIIPRFLEVFGKGVPVYIAFNSRLFSFPLSSDADVRSLTNHELRHVEDWYKGIILGDARIFYDTMSAGAFMSGFVENLGELRAYYTELEVVFREITETGRFSVSREVLASDAFAYHIRRKSLAGYPDLTDAEKKARERQFELVKGIVSIETPDGILLESSLFGETHMIQLRKRPDSEPNP